MNLLGQVLVGGEGGRPVTAEREGNPLYGSEISWGFKVEVTS